MNVLIGLLTAVHVLVALFLIVLVLMQKSSEQGVGAAFGGGMTETVFGGGTTTALVRMTIWCACIMLATTLILAVLHSHRGGSGSLMQKVVEQPATIPSSASQPPTLPTPTTPATPAAPGAPTKAPSPPPASAPAEKTP
jgi:preprotein translocase subunit SecG